MVESWGAKMKYQFEVEELIKYCDEDCPCARDLHNENGEVYKVVCDLDETNGKMLPDYIRPDWCPLIEIEEVTK